MLSKIEYHKKTGLTIRKGLAIRNKSVLTNLFLIASSDCVYFSYICILYNVEEWRERWEEWRERKREEGVWEREREKWSMRRRLGIPKVLSSAESANSKELFPLLALSTVPKYGVKFNLISSNVFTCIHYIYFAAHFFPSINWESPFATL